MLACAHTWTTMGGNKGAAGCRRPPRARQGAPPCGSLMCRIRGARPFVPWRRQTGCMLGLICGSKSRAAGEVRVAVSGGGNLWVCWQNIQVKSKVTLKHFRVCSGIRFCINSSSCSFSFLLFSSFKLLPALPQQCFRPPRQNHMRQPTTLELKRQPEPLLHADKGPVDKAALLLL